MEATHMIMKNYVADELANKVYHLHKALQQADEIIDVLRTENSKLQDALNNLASSSNKDYILDSEAWFEPTH
jgi:hypothetical protein